VSNDDHRHHLHTVPSNRDHEQRTPPNNADAERAVLGGMLMSKTAIADCVDLVAGPDFYRPANEVIFNTITDLYAHLEPVDAITVTDHLAKTKDLGRIGGSAYLYELINAVAAPSSASYYAQIVAEQATLRHLVEAGTAITALGYTGAGDNDIPALVQAATNLVTTIPTTVPGTDRATTTNTWAPVDLADIRDSGVDRPKATVLTTDTGQGLIYPHRIHSIAGESTTGKSWAMLAGLIQEIEIGHPCTYIDFEDRADTLLARCEDMGANPAEVDRLVRYISPETAFNPAAWTHIETATKDCRLVIIDGVTEAMTMHNLSLMDNEDIAHWFELLPRRIANLGPGVMQIDHVVKDADNRGRFAIGGQHKLSGITGAAYSMLAAKSFAIGQAGHSRIVVAKDRHGDVGPVGHTVAELHMTPNPARSPTAVTWSLTESTWVPTADGRPRLTGYMVKVSKYVQINPGATKRTLLDSGLGKDKYVASAIDSLLLEGCLRIEPGAHNAQKHFLVRAFEDDA
jgi:hypothetical protein